MADVESGRTENGAAPNLVKESAEAYILTDEKFMQDADLEVAAVRHRRQALTLLSTLDLAYRSIGVIFGDIGTSPLYVYNTIFDDFQSTVPTEADVLGACSCVLWTLTLIVLLKYIVIVLLADDNGEGGTFALYSLLCRSAQLGTPKDAFIAMDADLDHLSSGSQTDVGSGKLRRSTVKTFLKSSKGAQYLLLFIVLAGTAMVIGINTSLDQHAIVGITCALLVVLFCCQWVGTHWLGAAFSPIVLLWFLSNSIIGIYNIIHYHPGIWAAVSPHYAFRFLIDHGHQGWISLGGIFLCVTGVEAMYADLGHFTRRAVQLSFVAIVFPSLVLTYLGQAAYLVRFPENVGQIFYDSVPHKVYWPMLVLATATAALASQAMISAAFSIIRQSTTLGCFPRFKVVHTSAKIVGQVYIPEVNYILMVLSVAAVGGFQTSSRIASAYGVAVVFVQFITDCLLALVMLVVWGKPLSAAAFFLVFGALDGTFLSATLNKFTHGGWFPLAIAAAVFAISLVWYWGQTRRGNFMRGHNIPLSDLLETQPDSPRKGAATSADTRAGAGEQQVGLRRASLAGIQETVCRVPGIAVLHADTVFGVPPVFQHMLTNLPAIHQIVIFMTVREVPVPRISRKNRFLVTSLDYQGFYRCVARFGYMQDVDLGAEFEAAVVAEIHELTNPMAKWPSFKTALRHQVMRQKVEDAQASKVVYFMSRVDLISGPGTHLLEGLLLDYFYAPMERNTRSLGDAWRIPRDRLIEVGMQYAL